MDRTIDPSVIRARRTRRILQVIVAVCAIVGIAYAGLSWMRPSLDRSEIQVARVRRGVISGSISASGTVVPASEEALSSPGESRLLSVRKRPGEYVKPGESLLELDRSELALSLDKTEKELALKANERKQLSLDLDRSLQDLNGQLSIKDLRLEYLRSKSLQSDKMLELGAISRDQMEQTKLEERIANIEREKLNESIRNTRESLDNRLEGLTTEVRTLLHEKDDIRRQLDLLSCTARRGGIVTWVKSDIGAGIHRGEIIARVADLSHFRVEVSVSDIHAAILSVGMSALVRLADSTLAGRIATVYPAIENGVARVSVELDDDANRALRPNQRLDVDLVTSKREGALLVKKGPFANGNATAGIFRIEDGRAMRVALSVGVMNMNDVEILDGGTLAEGDEVIISDMSAYEHLSFVTIH
jgi:HlyD family secretion protein